MSGGLFALLDDIAAMAKLAAASIDDVAAAAGRASAKASGVVIDDAAVTPRFVTGFSPTRELPMIKRIAIGSMRNKLLIILPIILALSQWAPFVLTPLLMLGGCYLSYEGAHKIWGKILGHDEKPEKPVAVEREENNGAASTREDKMVKEAITTDFILSAEIMVISLNEVADEGFWSRLFILLVVALGITIGVYGVVALLVKMDDIGLHMGGMGCDLSLKVGTGLVAAMPKVLKALSVIGTAAMLWVGGHILLVGTNDLGWHTIYDVVHGLEVTAHDAAGGAGGAVGWLVNTALSAVIGFVVGSVLVGIISLLPVGKKGHGHDEGHGAEGHDGGAHAPATADRSATTTGTTTTGSLGSGGAGAGGATAGGPATAGGSTAVRPDATEDGPSA